MGAVTREKFVRIAVFLLLVVVLCIVVVVLLSQVPMSRHLLLNVSKELTLAAVALAYFGAYKPGWVFRSLVEASQGGP